MKKITLILILALVAMACKKEGCTDPTATNYSSEADKDDGSCIIPVTDPRDAFIGSYWVTQETIAFGVSQGTADYALLITKDPTSTSKLILENMFDTGYDYSATLSGNNFSFSESSFPGGNGSGSFGTNTITYTGQADIASYSGTGSK